MITISVSIRQHEPILHGCQLGDYSPNQVASSKILGAMATKMVATWRVAKIKPPKIPRASNKTPQKSHAIFLSHKNFRGTTRPEYAGTITNLKVILNNHKNPYLNLATQKTTCQNFLIQKLPKWNISNPTYLLIISVTWNPEYLLRRFKAYSNTLFLDS